MYLFNKGSKYRQGFIKSMNLFSFFHTLFSASVAISSCTGFDFFTMQLVSNRDSGDVQFCVRGNGRIQSSELTRQFDSN